MTAPQLLFAALCLLAPVQAQEPAPTAPPKVKLPASLAKRFEDPFKGLIPGRLPEGTSPAAAELHKLLLKSSALASTATESLTSFDLHFEIIARGSGPEHNQAVVRVRFLEPGFVRFSIGKQKEMGYGPPGYWQRFEDGAKLLNSRDYVADRKRITEVRAVAKNFMAMADPRRLRLTSAVAMDGPPVHLPPGSAAKMAKLRWLALESPDFDLAIGSTTAPKPARLFRAQLGLNPTTGRVEEALVQEVIAGKVLVNTSTWVSSAEPMALGDAQLPRALFVRYPDMKAKPWSFERKIREEVYLIEGQLNPKLSPTDFALPPK